MLVVVSLFSIDASSLFTAIQAASCSGLGGSSLLPSAACHETEFGCRPSLLHESLAAQSGSRPATLFPVQSPQPPAAPATDQPAVLNSPVMDQLVSRVTDEVPSGCSHCFQFKLNGPASTKSPLHIISSTCRVIPCVTVHSFTVLWIQHPTSPRTCCHPRYSRGTSCSRWRPVSFSLPVR